MIGEQECFWILSKEQQNTKIGEEKWTKENTRYEFWCRSTTLICCGKLLMNLHIKV